MQEQAHKIIQKLIRTKGIRNRGYSKVNQGQGDQEQRALTAQYKHYAPS